MSVHLKDARATRLLEAMDHFAAGVRALIHAPHTVEVKEAINKLANETHKVLMNQDNLNHEIVTALVGDPADAEAARTILRQRYERDKRT